MTNTPRFSKNEDTKQLQPKIGFVSLGCPKALVDSERIITQLRKEGYDISSSYEDADAVIVNTCGFIDSAKAESFSAIKEAMRENGKVIVTGCLIAEEEKIRQDHPNILAVTGPHQIDEVIAAVKKHVPVNALDFLYLTPPDGLKLTPRHYAYLKISEGCNNSCSFCIIPSIRGKLTSRQMSAILQEAEELVQAGVKELLVISQDTSAYGIDKKYEMDDWEGKQYKSNIENLARLLGDMGIWVRLHYVYPYPHVDKLIPLMRERVLLPYLDIPFQHASPSVLKNMRRPAFAEKTKERILSWRETCPDLALRSTFIVGFPGESDDDFNMLMDWMDEVQIDRVGCFKYENVAGAPSRDLPDHVPQELIDERHHLFLEKAQHISAKRLEAKIGQMTEVIIDEVDDEGAIGRTIWDAPDVDGALYLNGEINLNPGDKIITRITHSDHYDLWGELIKPS